MAREGARVAVSDLVMLRRRSRLPGRHRWRAAVVADENPQSSRAAGILFLFADLWTFSGVFDVCRAAQQKTRLSQGSLASSCELTRMSRNTHQRLISRTAALLRACSAMSRAPALGVSTSPGAVRRVHASVMM